MTLIERAARALVVELQRQDGVFTEDALAQERVVFDLGLRIQYIDQNDVDCGALVRAVLQAIREPSEAMREAVDTDLDFPWWFRDAVAGGGEVTNSAWQRMIDAALEEV